MGNWYKVTKKINGRLYLYWQKTYRVGSSVKTLNKYIGPANNPPRMPPLRTVMQNLPEAHRNLRAEYVAGKISKMEYLEAMSGQPRDPAAPAAPAKTTLSDFGRNDRVLLIDIATGAQQERTIKDVMPGGLKVVDDISGIPRHASEHKWYFKLLKKGDPNAPWPKTGITFKELAEMEDLEK